ncbi:MAG TPA: HupE/UreJ family protein [Solimonas sp.]|nr:HupE/UreJ family protein [Solimonas sp.]
MSRLAILLAWVMLGMTPGELSAHSMNSAQWRLQQLDAQTWDSRLRLPEDFEGRLLPLQVREPPDCRRLETPRQQPVEEGTIYRWQLHCPHGLAAGLSLSGFTVQLPDAVLSVQPLRGPAQYAVLSATQPEWSPQAQPLPPPVAHYLGLGVEHILLGPDHLLFVLGLFLLWRRSGRGLARLVATLTAFTIAHSLTLGGALLGGWSLPAGAVEASIAASILLLALELARDHAGDSPGPAQQHPHALAFAFGLLHGFGFAGALAEIGLPEQARVWALAAFNLGVEAGQLLFVLAALAVLRWQPMPRRWAPVALCLYGSAAGYWVIERSVAVLA